MVYTSQLGATLAILAVGTIGSVGAVTGPSNEHIAVLLSRQAPGTPAYDCHNSCGTAITLGRDGAHCTNSTWQNLYQECLECALDFDIWKYYGGSLTGFAKACGLSTVPSPSGDDSAAPSTSSSAASPPTTLETTTTAAPPTTSDTGSAESTTTEAVPSTSAAVPDTGLSTPTSAPTTTQSATPGVSTTGNATTAPPVVGTGSTNASRPTTTGNVVVTAGAAGSSLAPSFLGVTAMALIFLRGLW